MKETKDETKLMNCLSNFIHRYAAATSFRELEQIDQEYNEAKTELSELIDNDFIKGRNDINIVSGIDGASESSKFVVRVRLPDQTIQQAIEQAIDMKIMEFRAKQAKQMKDIAK